MANGGFQTIVCSIPGVGKWVWTEVEAIVEFYPNSHIRKNTPKPDARFTMKLTGTGNNNADRALKMASLHMYGNEFLKEYGPSKRLKRFMDS